MRVHLNVAVLEALLDVFPWLEEILIFSPMMVDEGAKSLDPFPHLQEHRYIPEIDESSNAVDPGKDARWVNSVTLLFPPQDLIVGLADRLPLCCRELGLAEDSDYGVGTLNLLLDSAGPTLESLDIRGSSSRGKSISVVDIPVSDHVELQVQPSRSKTVQSCAR